MEENDINAPNFREDPALYEDDIIGYLQVLERCDQAAFRSARKPSLSDYDLHDDDDDSSEETRESYRLRRLQ